MNEDNITGFNSALVKKNIEEFKQSTFLVNQKLTEAFDYLFDELSNAWNSPKAHEFFSEYRIKIKSLQNEFEENVIWIVRNALRAYNSMLEAHGGDRIFVDININYDKEYTYHLSDTGIIGMKIKEVRNNILPSFNKMINNACSEFDNVPTSIALYDSDNGQKYAYETNVKEIKKKIQSFCESIRKEIENALETEMDIVGETKNKVMKVLEFEE